MMAVNFQSLANSFQFQGLCLMKRSYEMLQNLLYFMHRKTQSCFIHGILYCQLTHTWSFVRKKNKVALNGKRNYRFFMHKTYQILKGFPRTFCQADILIWGILGAYCSLDTFFCANILICYIMQKQIHSTYLYKLFYLKWQLGLLDIENKEII